MKKCPHCNEKTIKTLNGTLFNNTHSIKCTGCGEKIGINKLFATIITVTYVIYAMVMFLTSIPGNIYYILGAGVLLTLVQLFIVPFEKRK